MRGYVAWLFVGAVMAFFVYAVREGPIHVAAWSEPCHVLRTGGAIKTSPLESNLSIINRCTDLARRP